MSHRRSTMSALALCAALNAGGLLTATGPAAAAQVIQPGSSLEFGGSSFCTANWVYDGTGGPYIGAAGHCASGVGERVDLATGSLGSSLGRIGQVAFISPSFDYCLVKLDAAVLPRVSAAMAGHAGIPKGVSTPSTAKRGDLIQFSGHGVGFDFLKATEQKRVGIFNFFLDGYQYVLGAVTPGDSGGPVADISDGKKAIGIVDTIGVTIATPKANVGEGGVAVYALLADAAANGISIRVRTV